MNALIRLGCFALILLGKSAVGNQDNYENTTWRGLNGELGESQVSFYSNGSGSYGNHNGKNVVSYSDMSWKQEGNLITWEVNNKYVVYQGEIHKKILAGVARNKEGLSWNFLFKLSSPDTSVFSPKNPFIGNAPELIRSQLNREFNQFQFELNEEKRKQAAIKNRLGESENLASQSQTTPTRPAISLGSERRVALVIGNATYKNSPLRNPVNDSNDMAQSLKAVGFDVVQINNATLAQMREATRLFADKLTLSDVGLVYYSGHGLEVKGKNYLVPVNADITREYEVADQAFDASQFLEMMESIRGPNAQRVNILIVDACRNNDLPRSWRSASSGLARMDAPGGTFISFATAPGKVAADGQGRNSPYTKHLLQAMKQPNVPIEQAFKLVRRNVMDETKGEQVPWDNSSLVGDFYFMVQR